ncbi:MAG: hypothetical protein MUQ10_03765 [Anaerolineae bacterium]|nr:hypothetical protein [Anaerolineae bacterium]
MRLIIHNYNLQRISVKTQPLPDAFIIAIVDLEGVLSPEIDVGYSLVPTD